jgi:hypothetical protein
MASMLPLGLNGDFGMSPSYGQTRREALAMALYHATITKTLF